MRINAEHLPPPLSADGFTHHVVLNGRIDGGFGDTLIGAHEGELVVLTRGSSLDDFAKVALDPKKPPALTRQSFESTLMITTAAGKRHDVSVLSLDVDDVAAVLAAGTARAKAPEKKGADGPAFAELERHAIALLEAERFTLAGQALENLAKSSGTPGHVYLTLAESAQLLSAGDPEGAFFKLQNEAQRTVTPTWVLSKATGTSLLAHHNLPMAAAAFALASVAAASGNTELAARAREIRDEAGMDQVTLERAIIDATIEHYARRLEVDPDDNIAKDVLDRTLAVQARLRAAVDDAAEVVVAPIRAAAQQLGRFKKEHDTIPEMDALTVPEKQTVNIIRALAKGTFYAVLAVLILRACLG